MRDAFVRALLKEMAVNDRVVLIPGDLVDRHRRNNDYAAKFLKEIPQIKPLFYAIGNHERK